MANNRLLEERVLLAPALDFSKLPLDVDILLFGESHGHDEIRRYLKLAVPVFKSSGFQAYGVEAATKGREELKRISQTQAKYIAPDKVSFGVFSYDFPSYRELAYEMAVEGIEIFPFDIRHSNYLLPKDHRLTSDQCEKIMADIIDQKVREKGKTVILVGAGHLNRNPHSAIRDRDMLIDYLEKLGHKCLTVKFDGGINYKEREINTYVESAAIKLGRTADTFMLDNRDGVIAMPYNYIIHLPQEPVIQEAMAHPLN